MKTEFIDAWYFAEESRQLRWGDNRKIVVGEKHSLKSISDLCEKGLHASARIIDALQYAPGPILYRVRLSGKMDIGDDKISAQHREYLWEVDATEVLREFSRKQALINIGKIEKYVSKEDYELIVQYLYTGEGDIRRVAEAAAWSSPGISSGSAARAIWSATLEPVWSSSAAAARSATISSAAELTQISYAWVSLESANQMLEEMVMNFRRGEN